MERILTGTDAFDYLIGGYEKDTITTVYGPAGCGKTCICLIAAITAIKDNKKVIMIDTEGGFSAERFSQISQDESMLQHIMILKPTNFEEQKKIFERLKEMISPKIGLIIVDSISMLYRLQIGKSDAYDAKRELGNQISYLSEIARKNNIPILLTNQVYSSFDDKNEVKMVGSDLLNYGSKCLIELQTMHRNKRMAILRKHRSMPEKQVIFEITQTGLRSVDVII